MVIEPEIMEKPGRRRSNGHHRPIPRQITTSGESRRRRSIDQPATFSTVSAKSRDAHLFETIRTPSAECSPPASESYS
jgi:hypothetical protein